MLARVATFAIDGVQPRQVWVEVDIRAGLPRILALLDEHEIPATFMVPAQVADEHPGACREIAARGVHEFGYHGVHHESVLDIPVPRSGN